MNICMKIVSNPVESNLKMICYTKLFEIRDIPRLIELLEYRNRIIRECRSDELFADAMIQTNDLIKQYLNI